MRIAVQLIVGIQKKVILDRDYSPVDIWESKAVMIDLRSHFGYNYDSTQNSVDLR